MPNNLERIIKQAERKKLLKEAFADAMRGLSCGLSAQLLYRFGYTFLNNQPVFQDYSQWPEHIQTQSTLIAFAGAGFGVFYPEISTFARNIYQKIRKK